MSGDGDAPVIVVDAGDTALVLAVAPDGSLRQIGFGGEGIAGRRPELPVGLYPLAYPTFGEEVLREPALRVTHADGATSTRLRYVGHTTVDLDPDDPAGLFAAPEAGRAGRAGRVEHRVELADRVAPLCVARCFRTWPAYGLLEEWVEVVNRADAAITLHQAAASAPAFAGPAPHLTHWGGGWAGEWTQVTEALAPGTKTVASAGGVRPSLYRPPIVLFTPDGPAGETTGSVGACTVAWGGDVRFDAEVFLHGHVRVIAGHQHRGAERTLDPGERFTSPVVRWTWSDDGIGRTSRTLHRFAREQVVRDGTGPRATVVNTWEAVGFALDPAGLAAQVDAAADLGGELFLVDDGWFGTTHPRDDDTTGLGDWEVDRRKLPDGLAPLVEHTISSGLRFGLWVEPEMVNAASALHEAHPGWVIGEPGRERREERNQLVLDVLQPDVRDFVVGVIDRVLADHPGITYLKWDANRDVTEPGSPALPADRQSHLALDRVHATRSIMAEVARRHPDVELMLCASGGGRSDLDTLQWFHELWTSDDTDPVDRVRIQWGASHLLPASVLAAHVTRWGAKPFAFACAVALSGRFGFDVDLTALTDDERAVARDAVATAHRIRDVVEQGDLHRLVSPVGSDRAALAHVSRDGDRAVVFLHRLADGDHDGQPDPAIEVPGLGPVEGLHVVDLTPGRAAAGDGVDAANGTDAVVDGLAWPTGPAPCSAVYEVTRRR